MNKKNWEHKSLEGDCSRQMEQKGESHCGRIGLRVVGRKEKEQRLIDLTDNKGCP
jgi:hypothetical protein